MMKNTKLLPLRSNQLSFHPFLRPIRGFGLDFLSGDSAVKLPSSTITDLIGNV